MPNFIGGLPAQGSPLTSADVRNNFLALNARTGKITPRATNPASTSITVDAGTVYFADRIVLEVSALSVDLGDAVTGAAPFVNTGFFRDVVLVLRLNFDSVTSRYGATLLFLEGPEKSSSVSQPELVSIGSTDLPIARLLIRHNGINNTDRGQIEPITQQAILDFRNYLDVGGPTYFSASVGDRQVSTDAYGALVTDAYGVPIITGETIGTFVDGYSPIQEAIDSIGSTGGTIFIKRGTYVVDQTINVPSNVQLIGEGKSTVIQILSDFTGPMFGVTGSNVHFSNLTLQGPLPGPASSDALILFISSTKCTVRDCYLESGVVGVEFDSASDRNICMNNYFDGNSVAANVKGDKNIITYNQFENSLSSDITNTGTGNLTAPNVLS